MHGFLIQNATAFDEGLWICKAQFNNVKQSRRIQVSVNAGKTIRRRTASLSSKHFRAHSQSNCLLLQ